MDVSGIVSVGRPAGQIEPGLPKSDASGTGSPFASAIADALQDVSAQQQGAQNQIIGLATGQADNLHDVVLSVAKADLAFQLVLEIRNQLIASYQELMRMQV